MDKKYLHRVIDQIVSETKIDFDEKKIYFPFSSPLSFSLSFLSLSLSFYFVDHCREIYGLNDDEVEYVWNEYINSITDKIENGL